VADADVGGGDAALQVMLLLVLLGYIAIAVANSVVITTLGRRREFSVLRVVGTTPAQLRRVGRVEGVFLAAAGGVVGMVLAAPGLAAMAYALSHGATIVPSIDPVSYAAVVTATCALALGVSAVSTRLAMRNP
jgi:putative ABC transport system permease protein